MKPLTKWLKKHQLLLGIILINVVLIIRNISSYYFFELLNSLSFQILIVLLAISLFLILKRMYIGLACSLLSIYILLAHIAFFSSYQTEIGNYKITHFNVLKLNNQYHEIINYAETCQADLLSFNEVSPDWASKLQDSLSKSYPYHIIQLAENNSFGIALFSKYPLKNSAVKYWGSQYIPSIVTEVLMADKTIHIEAAHTIPPTRQKNLEIRNRHLRGITNYFSKINGSKILVRDLNTVSWSEALQNLKHISQLEDSRKAWQPTFPSTNWLMSIPIDHIFHSKDMRCVQFKVIKSTTSDHHGIEGEYVI